MRAAAQALCALTLKNQANKTRCASLDAVATLLDLATVWGVAEDGERTGLQASMEVSALPPNPRLLRDEADVFSSFCSVHIPGRPL